MIREVPQPPVLFYGYLFRIKMLLFWWVLHGLKCPALCNIFDIFAFYTR